MKKIVIFVLTIMSLVTVSSCATVKEYSGRGNGFSTDEQIAMDKADLNAAVDASKQNNWTVSEKSNITTVDTNGNAHSVYTSTRTGKTKTTFTNNAFKRKVSKNGKMYRAVSRFNGHADSE